MYSVKKEKSISISSPIMSQRPTFFIATAIFWKQFRSAWLQPKFSNQMNVNECSFILGESDDSKRGLPKSIGTWVFFIWKHL